ncbi:MAG: hypothetical protein LBK23_02445 [Oscillospiraceae bacterium]|jgi:hypothetical protein|nr:hypothetical protein [Oscillospiraceae bacterium]
MIYRSKAAAVLLAASLLLSLAAPSAALAEDGITVRMVKLYSTEIIDGALMIYVREGAQPDIFVPIDTAARLTRCTVSSDGDRYTLSHAKGMRAITIDLNAETLTEGGATYNIEAERHNGIAMVSMYPLLTYLGAVCEVKNDTLSVVMPQSTFWEAYSFILEKKMNVSLYSDSDRNIRVVCDLLIDFIFPSGRNPIEILLEGESERDAIYEVLKADIYGYTTVQSATQRRSARRTGALNKLSEGLGYINDGYGDAFDWLGMLVDANSKEMLDAIFSFNPGVVNYAEELKKLELVTESRKAAIARWNKSDVVSVALILVNICALSVERSGIEPLAVESMKRAYSEELLKDAAEPQPKSDYVDAVKEVCEELSSTGEIVKTAAIEAIEDFLIDKILEEGAKKVLDMMGAASGGVMLSVELGGIVSEIIGRSPIGKYTPFSMIPASEADLMAIMSSEFYEQTWSILSGYVNRHGDEALFSADVQQNIYDVYMTMLRASLLHFESRVKYSEAQMVAPKDLPELKRRASAIAYAIDMLNNTACKAAPRPDTLGSETALFNAVVLEADESALSPNSGEAEAEVGTVVSGEEIPWITVEYDEKKCLIVEITDDFTIGEIEIGLRKTTGLIANDLSATAVVRDENGTLLFEQKVRNGDIVSIGPGRGNYNVCVREKNAILAGANLAIGLEWTILSSSDAIIKILEPV